MPTTFPPTPAPSTDIKGREGNALNPVETAFALPPSAVGGSHQDQAAHVAPFASPISPVDSRKASSSDSPEVSLPPPPSRSRKIIQVKPKGSSEERDATYTPSLKAPRAAVKETGKRKSAAAGPTPATAAGRKVARKTAHSIIERRRRSKMNEEFGVLKDLIPACRGCEMHKLAILQASIEYLRYLENCVTELKAGRGASSEAPTLQSSAEEDLDHEQDASDDEMDVDDAHSHSNSNVSPREQSQPPQRYTAPGTSSTAISAASPHTHPYHRSSTSSAAPSTLPSPYFGPVTSHTSTAYPGPAPSPASASMTSPRFGPYYAAHRQTPSRSSISHPHVYVAPTQPWQTYSRDSSAHTSPVIFPQSQGLNEAEASTALLMLNQDRRRDGGHEGERRGMSVKDLLSN